MQKGTKNHPLGAVQSQISPNLLKKTSPGPPPPPKKNRKFLSSWLGCYKWLRCENDLFCDTCLTAKACSNPFTEGFTTSQNSTIYKKMGPPFSKMGPPSQGFSLTEIYFGHFVQAAPILFGHLEIF